jgi:hypothetical protein
MPGDGSEVEQNQEGTVSPGSSQIGEHGPGIVVGLEPREASSGGIFGVQSRLFLQ